MCAESSSLLRTRTLTILESTSILLRPFETSTLILRRLMGISLKSSVHNLIGTACDTNCSHLHPSKVNNNHIRHTFRIGRQLQCAVNLPRNGLSPWAGAR